MVHSGVDTGLEIVQTQRDGQLVRDKLAACDTLVDETPDVRVRIDGAKRFACLPVVDAWDRTEDLALSALAATRKANEQKHLI